MKEIDIKQTSEVEAAGKVSELWHCVKMIDKKPFSQECLKESFAQAAYSGKICLVALECIAAYPDASSQGIGKTPVDTPDLMQKYSTAFYNSEAIKHFIIKCHGLGINVDYHVFLEDDDFVYSVDPAWNIQNGHISQAIEFQKKHFLENFPVACGLNEKDTLKVHNCVQTEYVSEDIKFARNVIYQYIKKGIEGKAYLPGPVMGRFGNFLGWRKEIAKSVGFTPDGNHLLDLAIHGDIWSWNKKMAKLIELTPDQNHLIDLAVQELTGFAYQGHFAPLLAKEISGVNTPVYVNTYPGHYFADDLCTRLGIQWVGLKGLPLGTIHPNIDFYNKRLAPKGMSHAKSKGEVFTCGDPKGNPNY